VESFCGSTKKSLGFEFRCPYATFALGSELQKSLVFKFLDESACGGFWRHLPSS